MLQNNDQRQSSGDMTTLTDGGTLVTPGSAHLNRHFHAYRATRELRTKRKNLR